MDSQRAACVILTRFAPPDGALQVFLVRRSEKLVFLGGFHAFPGGRVDPADSLVAVAQTPADCASDFCSAALRELFEECGVLVAPSATKLDTAARRSMRQTLLADPTAWPRLLAERGLSLDASQMIPMGRWHTPPFLAAAFDAQYFAVPWSGDTLPEIWPGELTDGLWLSPTAALQAHELGRLFISYPVLETLRTLVGATCTADIRQAGQAMTHVVAQHVRGGELLHGVHALPVRTPTIPPATHTNCYILGGRELVIVDPGTPYADEQQTLHDYIDQMVSQGARVREVWLTHHHHDHVGAADYLRQHYKVPLAAHADAAAQLAPALQLDRLLRDNEEVHLDDGAAGATWQALLTPGHARGHLCFYEKSRGHLLSGDTILGMGTTLVAPSPDGSMGDYMTSLQRLLNLRLGMILPGHGPPVAAAKDKIMEYIQHRQGREAAIVSTLRQAGGPLDAAEIVRRVYVDVAPAAYVLAELNVRSHLEKLTAEGITHQAGTAYSWVAGADERQ